MSKQYWLILIAVFLLLCSSCEDRPPIVRAAVDGNAAGVRRLIQEGADPNKGYDTDNRNALGEASMHGLTEVVKVLVENGADIEKGARGMTNATPLMMAASYGHLETVQVLLAHGADVRRRDNFGHTALTQVLKNIDDESVLQMFLDNAQSAAKEYHDVRPQSIDEVRNRLKQIVKVLREAGVTE